MWEFIFSVVPLVLFCTAVGLVLINFDEVLSYFGFLAQSLIQPGKNTSFVNQYEEIPLDNKQVVKTSPLSIPFIIIQRLFTLIKVIFLPDLPNTSFKTQDTYEEVNIVALTAEKEAQKSVIKTYSNITSLPTQPTDIPTVITRSNLQNSASQQTTQPIPNRTTDIRINNITKPKHSFPLFTIIRKTLLYLLIIAPFAVIGAGIMLFITESSSTGVNFDVWLTGKVEVLLQEFNIQ